MAQTPCIRVQDGETIPDPSSTTRTGGDVAVLGSIPLVVLPTDPNLLGVNTLATDGVYDVPKDTSTFTAGDAVYWTVAANPVVGTAGTGAAQSSGTYLMGLAIADAASGAAYVRTKLTAAKRTTTIAGSVTADDITGSDASMGITGAPPATTSSAGGAIPIAGGIGGSVSGAGGLVSVTGGAGTLNALGGVASLVGGAGNGTGAGAASKVTGGLGGLTGAGGAATITGGAGGATSGTGGAATLVGGAGTGTSAAGGAASVTGGASPGASGTAGAASIDAGAASSGTGATVNIADVNATATYLNRGPLKALQVGITLTALGTTQSSTPTSAQLLGGLLTQTGATGAGTVTLPTGTAISTACARTPVAGDSFDCWFINVGGGNTLTITGATNTTVSGTVAIASAKFALMKFYNVSANNWNVYCIASA